MKRQKFRILRASAFLFSVMENEMIEAIRYSIYISNQEKARKQETSGWPVYYIEKVLATLVIEMKCNIFQIHYFYIR